MKHSYTTNSHCPTYTISVELGSERVKFCSVQEGVGRRHLFRHHGEAYLPSTLSSYDADFAHPVCQAATAVYPHRRWHRHRCVWTPENVDLPAYGKVTEVDVSTQSQMACSPCLFSLQPVIGRMERARCTAVRQWGRGKRRERPCLNIVMRAFWWRIRLIVRNKLSGEFRRNNRALCLFVVISDIRDFVDRIITFSWRSQEVQGAFPLRVFFLHFLC